MTRDPYEGWDRVLAAPESLTSVYARIQWTRGMCSDEEPHHLIDQQLGWVLDALDALAVPAANAGETPVPRVGSGDPINAPARATATNGPRADYTDLCRRPAQMNRSIPASPDATAPTHGGGS